jgi:hypothetical protein
MHDLRNASKCHKYYRRMTCASDAMLSGMAKNKAAVAMAKLRAASLTPQERQDIGRMGGAVGGPARAASLSKKRRKEIAVKAAEARWGKKAGKKAAK